MTFKCFLMHLLTKFLFFSGQSKKEVFLTYFVLFKYVRSRSTYGGWALEMSCMCAIRAKYIVFKKHLLIGVPSL